MIKFKVTRNGNTRAFQFSRVCPVADAIAVITQNMGGTPGALELDGAVLEETKKVGKRTRPVTLEEAGVVDRYNEDGEHIDLELDMVDRR